MVLRLEQHLVVGVVGNRAAGGQRGQPRAAPAAQHAIDRVVVDQRAAPAAPRGEPLRQHRHDRREILARERAVWPRAAHERIERVLAPIPARRPRRRSAARARRAAATGITSAIELAAARRCRAAPRIPPARRARAGTGGPLGVPIDGMAGTARRAAGRSRSSAASRSGRRDRRPRCRCRARAKRSPPAP